MSSLPNDEPSNPADPASPREEFPLEARGAFNTDSTAAEFTETLASEARILPIEAGDDSLLLAPPVDRSGRAAGAAGLPQDWIEPIPPMLFQSFEQPEVPYPTRIPHFGHLGLLSIFALIGLLCSTLLTRSALQFHLFGVSTLKAAVSDIHYTLGSMAILYLLTLLASIVVFPLLWHKGFFAGLQWRGATAFRLRRRLATAAFFCFVLALLSGWLMPGPSNAPIDKMFHTPSAAWLMFGFGVTFAPLFEGNSVSRISPPGTLHGIRLDSRTSTPQPASSTRRKWPIRSGRSQQ